MNGRMSRPHTLENEVRYFSAIWETEALPDFECLVDVLEMAADDMNVEFAPIGYVEADGGVRIRVDGQFRRGIDEKGLETFGSSLGKAMAAHVIVGAITPDMAHPKDVATAKRIRALCDEDHLSAKDFVLLDSLEDETTPPISKRGRNRPRRGPFNRRSAQCFGGPVFFSRDTDWGALGQAVSFLDEDHDVEISMGTIEREGHRVKAVLVAKVFGDGDAETSHIQSLVAESLGCEVELRELGHTMTKAEDLALMEKAKLCARHGPRRPFADADDLVEALREAAEGDSDSKGETASEQLSRIVGLKSVKAQLAEAVDFAAARMKAGLRRPTLHMCFRGNPGTGKTTVARALATMLAEAGVTEKDKFVDADRETLVGKYVGHTAVRTKSVIERAKGGVLFIDEAYALDAHTTHDYGPEAIATLVKGMEDLRDDLVVVLAGYAEPMEQMISMNPGLRDRIAFYVDFPDYSAGELFEIAKGFATRDGYSIDAEASEFLLKAFADVVSAKDADFANARIARKIVERAEMRQATLHGEDLCLHRDVFESVLTDPDIARLVKTKAASVGF